jgi:hypothetical protein
MRSGLLPMLAVGVVLTATGCPKQDDDWCADSGFPAGAEFEVTIAELVSSKFCDIGTAKVGEVLTYTTGSPRVLDEDAGCLLESGLPPAGSGSLHGFEYESCFEVASGFTCQGHSAACVSQDARMSVTTSIPRELSRVGDEGDGTYTVHLVAQAQAECPALSCIEKFATRVKRLR